MADSGGRGPVSGVRRPRGRLDMGPGPCPTVESTWGGEGAREHCLEMGREVVTLQFV